MDYQTGHFWSIFCGRRRPKFATEKRAAGKGSMVLFSSNIFECFHLERFQSANISSFSKTGGVSIPH